MTQPHLGIDLGATKAAAAVVAGTTVLGAGRWPTGRHLGPEAALDLLGVIGSWAQGHSGVLEGAGIGFPGIVAAGTVASSVMLDGWDDVPFAELAGEQLRLPVVVDNDVNCAALAENICRGRSEDLLLVSVGTGIGGAVVLNGRLWHGVGGLAGEIGHMSGAVGAGACDCGGHDCLHLAAGGRAIEVGLGLGAGTLAATTSADVDAAVFRAAELIGRAVADAVCILAVPLVVIAGGLADRAGFVEAVAASFDRYVMADLRQVCRVEASVCGRDVGALGAAMLSSDSVGP